MYYSQEEYDVKFEWGLDGLLSLLPVSDVIVIVDVLSFSTCVDIATNRGAIIYPYQWKDQTAQVFADQKGALLANTNRKNTIGYSLSPHSLLDIKADERLVLPSPNGSTLSLSSAVTTLCGCLRNAEAIAKACQELGKRISVIAAGERWVESGNLRVAYEDLLGAGAIISYLDGALSIEAKYARLIFEENKSDLRSSIMNCGSGKELIGRGFAQDVNLATELNVSTAVPLLKAGVYSNSNS
ncbi:MAG: 2-phosphosulfolactate phosphatase [Bacteroidota bacterium]